MKEKEVHDSGISYGFALIVSLMAVAGFFAWCSGSFAGYMVISNAATYAPGVTHQQAVDIGQHVSSWVFRVSIPMNIVFMLIHAKLSKALA